MKKHMLALAVASVVAAPAMADLTVYGKAFLTMDNNDANDTWHLNSNSSRLGVKGKTELNEGLNAIYKLEFGVDFAEGVGLSQRDVYVGLQGAGGTFIAGKFDTPLKKAAGGVDLFGDLPGDIKHTLAGKTRKDNAIQYTTPNLNGVSASLMLSPGEGRIGADGVTQTDPANAASFNLTYSNQNLFVGVGLDKEVENGSSTGILAKGELVDIARVAAQYTVADITLGAVLQREEQLTDTTGTVAVGTVGNGYLVSAAFNLQPAPVVLKVQYGNNQADDDSHELSYTSVGADYKLGKDTTALVYFTQKEDTLASVVNKTNTYGLGMVHKF